MEEPVLSEFLNEGAWFLEHLSPCLDSSDVVLEVFALAWSNIHLEVVDEGFEVLESRDDVELFEVLNEFMDVWSLLIGTLDASLEFREVVLTDHAVNETSQEFWNSDDSTFNFELLTLWEWEDEVNGCCGVFSRVEVVLGLPVNLNLTNVGLDLSLVEEVVLGGGLDKLAWALVGIKPFINLGHIVIQVLAGAKGTFEIRHDGTDLFDSSNIFTRLDVIKGSLSLSDDT